MLKEVEGGRGLKKEEWLEHEGDGTTLVKAGSKVWVHFTVTVESSQEVVDSSRGEHMTEVGGITVYKPKNPLEMSLAQEGGEESVFPGFALALKTMTLGERAGFLVPHDLAYGPAGKGKVGPGEALELNVEVLGIDGALLPPGADF
eukprot:CAMPEP_0114113918 /NCGR_PEP_ID=MMETSP0043_2-20121206/3164_1 /TAXON_ID=464988 /ORGANISM="Hemiselmis andersenii, Strain CCMP644" /LENGTH=145 /DNA_ID=CAMNT_0001206091 /DNA_START=97 /DNA_END=532 /DNA_ORIENTATION=-